MVHGLRCSVAGEIFPDQGLNPFTLHWQVCSLHRATTEAVRVCLDIIELSSEMRVSYLETVGSL